MSVISRVSDNNFVNAMIKSGVRCRIKVRCTGHEVLAWHKFLPEACIYVAINGAKPAKEGKLSSPTV